MLSSENKPVIVKNESLIMDNQYITNSKTTMIFNKVNNSNTNYVLKDTNGNGLLYATLNSKDKSIISNTMKDSIIKFKILNKTEKAIKLHIYKGDNEVDKQIVNITLKKSFSCIKFEIEYELKEGESKSFEARTYPDNEIAIYYGRRKEGGQLLCKANKAKIFSNKYSIEFSEGVDMASLFIFLIIVIKSVNSISDNDLAAVIAVM